MADEHAPVTREHRYASFTARYRVPAENSQFEPWLSWFENGCNPSAFDVYGEMERGAQAIADAERSYRLAAEERLDAITSRIESIRSALDENKLAEAWEAGYLAAERDGFKRLTENPHVAKQPAEALASLSPDIPTEGRG